MAELSALERAIINKKRRNHLFLGLMGVVMLIVLIPIVCVIVRIFGGGNDELYQLVALLIMLVWFGGLSAYYAWSIYFYNINRGLTDESWAEWREKNKYSPDGSNAFPAENPHAEETLGLPKGTIRGTLALTLMVGGLAMTIAALGMENSIKEDTFLVDNFDFFKTAFLMMIAFYFGNKSLEMIGYKSKKIYSANDVNKEAANQQSSQQPIPVAPSNDGGILNNVLGNGDSGQTLNDGDENKDTVDNEFDYPGAVQ